MPTRLTRLFALALALSSFLAGPLGVAQAQWMLPDSRPAAQVEMPNAGIAPEPVEAPPATRGKQTKAQKATRNAKPAEFAFPYYIEFRSRGAISYGHTFVMFGRTDSLGNMLPGEVAGLHPAGGTTEYVAGHYLPVPAETGPSDGDLEEIYISNRYRINLTAEQYEKVLAFIRHKQATSKFWHAVLNNCNGFAGDIANYMGLQAPSQLLMPPKYIDGLKRLNNNVSRPLALGANGA